MITSREKSIFLVGMICFQWANRPRSRADYNKIEVLNQIAVTLRGLSTHRRGFGVLLRWSRRGSQTTPSFCSPFAHRVRKESMNPKVAHALRLRDGQATRGYSASIHYFLSPDSIQEFAEISTKAVEKSVKNDLTSSRTRWLACMNSKLHMK
jgi:hypothetical protein